MRHRKHTFKISRSSSHRKSLLSNMVCSLLKEGRISTTTTRAKEARRLAERMITIAKTGVKAEKEATVRGQAVIYRRRAVAILGQKETVKFLFSTLAPRYAERQGGYTRIVKLGQRIGDGADMAFLELIPAAAAPAAEGDAAGVTPAAPAAGATPAEPAKA